VGQRLERVVPVALAWNLIEDRYYNVRRDDTGECLRGRFIEWRVTVDKLSCAVLDVSPPVDVLWDAAQNSVLQVRHLALLPRMTGETLELLVHPKIAVNMLALRFLNSATALDPRKHDYIGRGILLHPDL
jgi:hypothetical protein